MISFGHTGYVALYRFVPARSEIRILSARHQRELGYPIQGRAVDDRRQVGWDRGITCVMMGRMAVTPAQQVEFLGNVQRLLSEGLYVASYMYALLIALAELAIERGGIAHEENGCVSYKRRKSPHGTGRAE